MMEVGVITEIIKETEKNWRFIIENPLYDEIKYVSGQLIQVAIPDVDNPDELIARNYSLSSWPNGTNKLEIIVTYLEGGKMSEYLFKRAKVGDEILYKGPMGIFTLPNLQKLDRDIYFVSTGSGISPFRSMLNWLAENPIPTKKIKLFFGTRTKADLCYYKEMLELEKKIPNFEYVPCLSQEKWEGHNGYVHSAYLPELTIADEKPLVYYCGWTRMIEEGRGYLADLGYQMKEDIRVEIFG